MALKQISWYLSVILILVLISFDGFSQVPVERSKDRIVISGIEYYLHLVKKGETAYSISRAYGITADELVKENPSAASGTKEGQSLRIRASLVKPVSAESSLPKMPRDESKYIYHSVQPGETVYSLSKRYSVSESDIVKSNPGIDITKLSLGLEVAIPRISQVAVERSLPRQDPEFYYHKVTRGETMYSISRRYGITVRDLRRANNDMRFPQVGDFLRIPGMKPEAPVAKPEVIQDTLIAEPDTMPVVFERPLLRTTVENLSGSFDVAVLLPFYLEENSVRREIDSSRIVSGRRIYTEINRSDDWIYPRSLGFVEMYEGILLAADTLRALGLDIKLHAFDIKSDTTGISKLISSGRLNGMDLIIGPVHPSNLSIVASWAGNRGIPVVSPVQLSDNSVLSYNPLLFMALPSPEVVQATLAQKMKDYKNGNFIIIHSILDQDIPSLRRMILEEVGSVAPQKPVNLKEMIFYSMSASRDSALRLARNLSSTMENVVLIASEDAPVMSESLINVHAIARKYNVDVYGYPGMRYLENFDHRVCFELGLKIFSPYWIDYSSRDVIRFNAQFREKFLTEPSEMSYAWQGYDIFYYFLSGLAIHGKEFLEHPEIHYPDLLHTEFDFRRKSILNGFENIKLFLIRYSNNYELELMSAGETHASETEEPDHF